MGCDIHIVTEKRAVDGTWERLDAGAALKHQDYRAFTFLAGVRNKHGIVPIAAPRGLPADATSAAVTAYESDGIVGAHSASWLSIEELLAFNYESPAGATVEDTQPSYRGFLGEWFFKDLQQLADTGAERIVFWFDN